VNPKNFFGELKRRNVYKVAIAYAVVAWLLMQVASQIFPFFEIPNWAVRLVVLLLVIGFPVAMILAWAFELTPEGIKRAEDVDLSKSIKRKTSRKLDFFIIAVLLLVIGALLFQRLHSNVSPAVSSSLEKSIAVLPFENFSEDKAFAFFADGVQDEILTDLAKIADLKVISRTSVMQYKGGLKRNLPEIAQALKVAHILEGSVQRSANRVRVSAQLIDARNDTHVWAEKYDRELADVFAIQSEIAEKIAEQLQAKLSPTEKSAISERPTSNIAAYDLYLKAFQIELALLYALASKDVDLARGAIAQAGQVEWSRQPDTKVLKLTDEALAAFSDHSRSPPDLAKAPREVEGSRSTGNLFLAAVAAFVGQKEAALQALSAGLPSRSLPAQLGELGVIWSPVFKPLRNEPRFLELVRAMKLPDYWRVAGWGDFCQAKGGDDFECIGP